jgi:hypothetical protein
MQQKRPFIIACLSICLMFFGLSLFPIFLFNPYSQEQLDFVGSQCGVTAFVVRHFGGPALAVGAALFFLSMGTIGFGLWRLLPWAGDAIIAVSFVGVCSGVEQLIEFKYSHSCRSVDFTGSLLSGVLLYYFSRSKMKQVFQRNSRVPAQPL